MWCINISSSIKISPFTNSIFQNISKANTFWKRECIDLSSFIKKWLIVIFKIQNRNPNSINAFHKNNDPWNFQHYIQVNLGIPAVKNIHWCLILMNNGGTTCISRYTGSLHGFVKIIIKYLKKKLFCLPNLIFWTHGRYSMVDLCIVESVQIHYLIYSHWLRQCLFQGLNYWWWWVSIHWGCLFQVVWMDMWEWIWRDEGKDSSWHFEDIWVDGLFTLNIWLTYLLIIACYQWGGNP